MAQLLFAGTSPSVEAQVRLYAPGHTARELSWRLGSYAARLDRDLADLAPSDDGSPDALLAWDGTPRIALLSETAVVKAGHVRQACPEAAVLFYQSGLEQACAWNQEYPEGRLFAIGARSYSREHRDQMRHRQRLLPVHEVEPWVATMSAVDEAGERPLWVSLSLSLLDPHTAPDPMPLRDLRKALQAVPRERVVGFEISEFPPQKERNLSLALTGVELLRDNILSWWS